jgi:hypothetical protein
VVPGVQNPDSSVVLEPGYESGGGQWKEMIGWAKWVVWTSWAGDEVGQARGMNGPGKDFSWADRWAKEAEWAEVNKRKEREMFFSC